MKTVNLSEVRFMGKSPHRIWILRPGGGEYEITGGPTAEIFGPAKVVVPAKAGVGYNEFVLWNECRDHLSSALYPGETMDLAEGESVVVADVRQQIFSAIRI